MSELLLPQTIKHRIKNMTIHPILRFLILVSLYACSQNSAERSGDLQSGHLIENGSRHGFSGNRQSGLLIENGPRQGFQYFNNGNEFNYRYYTMTIWNDTTVPVKLSLGFSQIETTLSDTSSSKIFLLPRHLTPKQQQFDTQGISKELKFFLDFESDKPVHFDKTLSPGEKCVLTFGALTHVNFVDPTTPYGTALLASDEKFALKIIDSLIIPCGQYSYIDK